MGFSMYIFIDMGAVNILGVTRCTTPLLAGDVSGVSVSAEREKHPTDM